MVPRRIIKGYTPLRKEVINVNFLKRKVIKTIPLWMLFVILIGTAAGAFLFISNLVSNNVSVTNPPIEISGSFESVQYVHLETVSAFTYTLNDPVMAVGYIVIEITQTAMTLAQVGGVTVHVLNDAGGDMTGAWLGGAEPINEGYRFIISESISNGAFDFGGGGLATAGEIYVGLTFEFGGIYGVSMQISQTY
jgi:hypothetical protein